MTLKRFILTLSLGLGLTLLMVVSAWLLVGDTTLVSALESRLEDLTDTRIRYQGSPRITRTLTPTLSTEQLVIEDRRARYRIEISSSRLQLDLPKLLFGQLDIPSLSLGDIRVTVLPQATGAVSADAAKTTGWSFAKPGLKPVLHHVQIGTIAFVHEGEELRLPYVAVDEITINPATDPDTLAVTAQIELSGEKFGVASTLPDLHNALRNQALNFSVTANNERIALGADGQIAFDKPKPSIQAAIRVNAPDISNIQTGIDVLAIPGALTADAQLAGNYDQLVLDAISAHWTGPDASDLKLTGRIDNVAQLDGMQLQLTGVLNNPRWLAPRLPDNVGNLKSVTLASQLTGAKAQLAFRDLKLQAINEAGLDLSLNGQFDIITAAVDPQPQNIDLNLAFSAPTTQAARALLFEQVPELGRITGTAELRSISGAPALQNIRVNTHADEGLDVSLKGNIARLSLKPGQPISGFELDVVMQAANTATLAKRLGMNLAMSGPTTLAYRIEGDTKSLAVNQIRLSAGEAKSVLIGAQGQLVLAHWDQDDLLQSVDLKITANSHTTASLNMLIGQKLPELGALSLNTRLHTVSGKHRADELRIQTRTGAPVAVSLAGSIDNVFLFPQAALQGLRLKVDATSADMARLNTLFGLQDKIPALGPFKARADITGSDQEFLISEVSITAGQDNTLLVSAAGRLGTLSAANDWHPQGADLRVNAQSTGSRAFANTLGYDVPEFGPIQAQANLIDKAKTLAIESARVQIGKAATPVLKANGFVADLFGAGNTRWDVQLNIDGHTLAAFADQTKLPDLGPLVGSLVITNSDGTLGIDTLELKTTQTALLSATVMGRFDDFHKPDTLSLDASLSARDLQLLGALFDWEWPAIGPVRIDSKITQADTGTDFVTILSAGDMRINADLNGVFAATPPQISGTITAHKFFFPELFGGEVEGHDNDKSEHKQIFSRTPIDYSWLNKVDLNVSLAMPSFNKAKSRLESAKFVIALKAGQLSVAPATLVYPKGKLDLALQVDTQTPPRVSFKAYAEDMDPWQTLDIQQSKKNYAADMDVDIAVSTSGGSAHELAANADGDLYLTMKNGKMRRDLLDVVLVDMVGWTIGKTTREKYYDIDCGIADYSIEQGVMTTKAFLIDAKNITISGEGRIDLGREQVDYALLPKKKSRIALKADPVKITGALNNPSVSVLPWKSAATTYGGLIFAPYIFVGLSATEYLSGALGIGQKTSPCLEYEKFRKPRGGISEH